MESNYYYHDTKTNKQINIGFVVGMVKHLTTLTNHVNNQYARSIPYRKFNNLAISDKLEYYKDIIFKFIMAEARVHNQKYVSIGPDDLISGKIFYRKNIKTDYNLFAWEIARKLGIMNRGCGNGMGKYSGQYQINGQEFLNKDKHFGIWDPNSEVRFHSEYFSLYCNREKLDNFYEALSNNTLDEFFKNNPKISVTREERDKWK
jgi:hypothetical protein